MVSTPITSIAAKSESLFSAQRSVQFNTLLIFREYSLSGSYRKILHLPKELSWSVLRYTDPDVPLAQSDEDKLLGYDAPAIVPDGKFIALQINLTLGTAAYATMALREVTKTETSSHFQTALTQASSDQQFRGSGEGGAGTGADESMAVDTVDAVETEPTGEVELVGEADEA